MTKTYIGLPTFSSHQYTKMAVASLAGNEDLNLQLVIVDGDGSAPWVGDISNSYIIRHEENRGLPAALNDIMDYVFKRRRAKEIIWMGNDVALYPEALYTLLEAAAYAPDFDYIGGNEVTVSQFVSKYPQWAHKFDGERLLDFDFEPWLIHQADLPPLPHRPSVDEVESVPGFHNFGLMRRSYFDKVGYADVGFFPAYYSDIDIVRRGQLAGLRFGASKDARYFHFHGRTAAEVHGQETHRRYFALNEGYYKAKWGGLLGQETHAVPFAGQPTNTHPQKRDEEEKVIEWWRWTPALFHNKHRGQRCIIACNGLGLNDVDMSLLAGEIVFGLNRFQLKPDLPVTYGVATNKLVLEQFGSSILLADVHALFIPPTPGLWASHVYGLHLDTEEERFSHDVTHSIWGGHTVTFAALQLAYFMGFHQVILIGCDHRYEYSGEPNEELVSGGADQNHFSGDYFGAGVRWNAPDLQNAERAYTMARDFYEAAGRSIINCSTNSALEVFPKRELKEVLND